MESKDIYNLQEAYMEVVENQQQLNETGKNDARIRRNISRFGGKYTPPTNWDPEANRGQGATVSPKQKEKRRRKELRQEEMEVYASLENAFESWVDSLLEEGYDLSDYTWDEMYEFYLDEAITSKKGKEKAEKMIAKRSTPSGRAKKGKGAEVATIKHISRSEREGLRGTPMTPTMAKNPAKSRTSSGTGNKAARRAGLTPTREKPNAWKEQVDLYDIILTHLLDEGYAETQEAAEFIMVNMSEEWRESIIGNYLEEQGVPIGSKNYGDKASDAWNKGYQSYQSAQKAGREMTPPAIPSGYKFSSTAGTIVRNSPSSNTTKPSGSPTRSQLASQEREMLKKYNRL